jgi:hypothetical protein
MPVAEQLNLASYFLRRISIWLLIGGVARMI